MVTVDRKLSSYGGDDGNWRWGAYTRPIEVPIGELIIFRDWELRLCPSEVLIGEVNIF